MKKLIYLFVLVLCTSFTNELSPYEGVYEFKSYKFYERIELDKNFRFKYFVRFQHIINNIEGNYRIKGDSLILDSTPQRDKIIVWEYNKGNKNKDKFYVKNKLGDSFSYILFAITNSNDTITLLNQFGYSEIKDKKIESFYIADTKGLYTPLYKLSGAYSNYFEVQVETRRTMDNEVWQIHDNTISPIGTEGKMMDYVLTKIPDGESFQN